MELGLWIPRVTGCCAATQAPESKKVVAFNEVITININVERHHFCRILDEPIKIE